MVRKHPFQAPERAIGVTSQAAAVTTAKQFVQRELQQRQRLRRAPGRFLEHVVEGLAGVVGILPPGAGRRSRWVADHLPDVGKGWRQQIERALARLERHQLGELGTARRTRCAWWRPPMRARSAQRAASAAT